MEMWLMLVEVRNASRCISNVGIYIKDLMLGQLRMVRVAGSFE
jgi:hypothetical protein